MVLPRCTRMCPKPWTTSCGGGPYSTETSEWGGREEGVELRGLEGQEGRKGSSERKGGGGKGKWAMGRKVKEEKEKEKEKDK